jgi:hypothetical protein
MFPIDSALGLSELEKELANLTSSSDTLLSPMSPSELPSEAFDDHEALEQVHDAELADGDAAKAGAVDDVAADDHAAKDFAADDYAFDDCSADLLMDPAIAAINYDEAPVMPVEEEHDDLSYLATTHALFSGMMLRMIEDAAEHQLPRDIVRNLTSHCRGRHAHLQCQSCRLGLHLRELLASQTRMRGVRELAAAFLGVPILNHVALFRRLTSESRSLHQQRTRQANVRMQLRAGRNL